MRKLWPPNYDLFSTTIWALITSLTVNLIMLVVVRGDRWGWVLYPGLMGAALLTGKGFENSDGFYWPIAFWVCSITFYYVMAWLLINASRMVRIRRTGDGT